MTDWQPIETAPKDGTKVYAGKWAAGLVSVPHPVMSRFLDGIWCANFGMSPDAEIWGIYEPQPTHWMPLPDPPPP